MTAPVSTSEGTKQKFVPKRRAPYLLQNEIINQSIGNQLDSPLHPSKELDGKRSNKQREGESIKRAASQGTENRLVNQGLLCSQGSITSNLNYHEEASKLCGIQKRIVQYFINCCMLRGEPITGPVTIETLSTVINTTKKTLKKVIQRVIEKGLMERAGGKTGKSGFSVFRFDKRFIDAFKLQSDLESSQNLANSLSLVQKTEPIKKSLHEIHILPQEWQDIDCADLEEIGFGLSQIRQIYNKGVNTADNVQTSINHFSFAMKHKSGALNKYKNKLATFMSVLQKGGAWVEHDYMSPQEIALHKLAKQRKDRLEKLRKLEEEFFSSEFALWSSNLSPEEKNQIIPDSVKQAPFAKDIQKEIALKRYFKEHIWHRNMPDELKKLKE